jgi:hypothetical protein
MKAKPHWITNLNKERREKVAPLILELNAVIRDDSQTEKYRQRRERELRADIANANERYERRIRDAAQEAAADPRQRLAVGSAPKAEDLADTQLYVTQYERRETPQERRQLVDAIGADLEAGNMRGALNKARAAETLNIPIGAFAAQLHRADPIKRSAQEELDVIEELTKLALAEPIRELAHAGLLAARERLPLKTFAFQHQLREDQPFMDQIEPGYTGPTVERDGYPMSPHPEPHDPERDMQRVAVERHRGDEGYDPALTAKRYEARISAGRNGVPTPYQQIDGADR